MAQISARARLVESGFKVLYAKGFNGCSVQDITDNAGVPKGSFYNHFKSKEGLALEALDLYIGLARLEMLQDESTSPVARLQTHFEFLASLYRKRRSRLGCLAGNFAGELSESSPPLRKELALRFAGWNAAVADVLRQAQAAGELVAAQDAEQLGRFVVAAWEGCTLLMKLNRSSQPIDDFFYVLFSKLLLPSKTTRRR